MFDAAQYKEARADIFRAYEEKYKDRESYLITDGVVDPEHYEGILFLLKEAYSKEKTAGRWDLCDELAQYGPWKMWHHVAKWTHGLLHTTADTIAPFPGQLCCEDANALLRKIAAVNVKKVDGKPSSDGDDLEHFVTENAALLRRELELAKPKIIVCGNTFDYLQQIFGTKQVRNCDHWYYWMELENIGQVLVLDYYHPAVPYPKMLTYYGLMGCYQQALQNKPE